MKTTRRSRRSWWAGRAVNGLWVGALVALVASTAPGCVRRSLTIRTEPAGALVYLNDEEVGRSPVTTDFLWYGDYDVIIRQDGCRTLRTHAVIKRPWYQIPPLDFFAEVFYPGRIHDARFLAYTLDPEDLPGHDELIERAEELRGEAFSDAR